MHFIYRIACSIFKLTTSYNSVVKDKGKTYWAIISIQVSEEEKLFLESMAKFK